MVLDVCANIPQVRAVGMVAQKGMQMEDLYSEF